MEKIPCSYCTLLLLGLCSFNALEYFLEQFDVLRDGSVILRDQAVLDYETVSSYSLIISAEDSGFPPLSSNTTLVINLLDVNDNVPVFTNTQSLFSTPEVYNM